MDILEWNDGYISFVFARTAIKTISPRSEPVNPS